MRPMRPWIAIVCAVAAAPAAAGEVELAVRAGQVFPFYKQSFNFDPGPFLQATFPGVTVQPVQDMLLEGSGGLALGAGLTWYLGESVGLEARVDTADVGLRAQEALVRVRIPLPAPLPAITTEIAVPATGGLERLKPVSLNLAARTRGSFRLRVSGGVSYLPSVRFFARSDLRTAGPLFGGVPVAQLALKTEAPSGEGEGRLGFNVGGGVEWPLSGHLSVTADARYFRFREQTLAWVPEPGLVLSPIEQQLLRELQGNLGPVNFSAELFQVTGGLSLRF